MNEKTLKNFHAQFQTFDDPQDTSESEPRLVALRAELARRGLDGFVVPHADRFQNEYLPPSEERLAWLTGFTGSAGAAVILAERAVLFVDGRYTLQARDQTDPRVFTIEHLVDKPPSTWIESNLTAAQKLDRIRAEIKKLSADALVVSDPHTVAWTFNIRGADISHTPLPLAFAIILA